MRNFQLLILLLPSDATQATSKNKLAGPHQTKTLLHSKGNHQQIERATYGMGGNICKPCI